MQVKIENVIWQFAKIYRNWMAEENADLSDIGMNIAAPAFFQVLQKTGHAVEEIDAEGNSIWRATEKFLRETGLEAGPLIVFGPEMH